MPVKVADTVAWHITPSFVNSSLHRDKNTYMCIHVYVYIHTYIHTYMCAYIHA